MLIIILTCSCHCCEVCCSSCELGNFLFCIVIFTNFKLLIRQTQERGNLVQHNLQCIYMHAIILQEKCSYFIFYLQVDSSITKQCCYQLYITPTCSIMKLCLANLYDIETALRLIFQPVPWQILFTLLANTTPVTYMYMKNNNSFSNIYIIQNQWIASS